MPRLKAHNEKELRALAKALNVPLSRLQSGPLEVFLRCSRQSAIGNRQAELAWWESWGHCCESHIERLMLWALLGERDFLIRRGDDELPPTASIDRLVIQYPVAGFTADFAVVPDCRLPAADCRLLVIECDGHDYHGGSGYRRADVARMARDRKRDRDIQRAGHVVLRFTGSQIVNDPRACAQEVLSFIQPTRGEQRG